MKILLTRKVLYVVLAIYLLSGCFYHLLIGEKYVPGWSLFLMLFLWLYGFAVIIKEKFNRGEV